MKKKKGIVKKKKVSYSSVKNKKIPPKKIRIKYKNVFKVFFLFLFFFLFSYFIQSISIKNIYIKGNSYLTDQEIIDLALLSSYPSSIKNSTTVLEKRLLKSPYIQKVQVKKKGLSEVIITVVENRPLFYNANIGKTVLLDGREVTDVFDLPILVNYVPDTVYEKFKERFRVIEEEIIKRISEIKYDQNIDEERFLLTMNDGNLVYINLKKMESLNNYVSIIKNFENKKGILRLDSGEYFTILED